MKFCSIEIKGWHTGVTSGFVSGQVCVQCLWSELLPQTSTRIPCGGSASSVNVRNCFLLWDGSQFAELYALGHMCVAVLFDQFQ